MKVQTNHATKFNLHVSALVPQFHSVLERHNIHLFGKILNTFSKSVNRSHDFCLNPSRLRQTSALRYPIMVVADYWNEVNWCYTARCNRCGKMTWQGCGKHVQQVMASVPESNRCKCPR
ncbi:hypothetical protein FGIG_06694 [Fasciola gigantica]|uniref:Uncharacterized protein n=1 Tax=Fasciola gigantica TaxID=46835 RepID=A0A504YU07_FASGI|nr:hypothetical protein FGIG_06694 [Fasciola gigantica]